MDFWRSLIVASSLAASAAATGQSRYDGDLIYEADEARPVRHHVMSEAERRTAEANLARFISPTLTRFGGEEEFRRYLGAVLAAERARRGWWALRGGGVRFAQAETESDVQSDAVVPICPPEDPMCAAPQGSDSEGIIVTGSRVAPSNRSRSPVAVAGQVTNGQITNNQMRNVEEGDIVKQINHYLLVLQDGRIFVVDTRARGRGTPQNTTLRGPPGRRLALADRVNVYRDAREDMWYDEMLVFGDRILVTGYSYRHGATELSVLRLDVATGRLAREGLFHISSNDYYSSGNYATRLIGDNLVIYTPFQVAEMARDRFRWPLVRRWVEGETADRAERRGRPLFDAAAIYRPVRAFEDPTVHTVSVCPLGPAGSGRDLECRTTAFVAPDTAQWYVTQDDAFIWTTDRHYTSYDSQACDVASDLERDYEPALAYRVPVEGAAVGVLAARGVPPDQFSFQSVGGKLFALLKDRQRSCRDEREPGARLVFADIPLAAFGATARDIGRDRYTPLPGVLSHYVANRFTDRHLVYGSLGRSRRGRPENSTAPVYVLPVDAPRSVRPLDIRHTVIRAEQAGNDIVLTGYRDRQGLFVTLIDLDSRPHIASSIQLDRRYESEGRSHAFNSLFESDGSGVMGLPTIGAVTWSSRAAWRSSASDLTFLEVDRSGRIRPVGELERRFVYRDDLEGGKGIPGYSCEVSCIDWYGNSRPIFTDGRIFALTGTEMIEGRITDGQIFELQRLNIALAPAPNAPANAAAGTK